MKRISLVIGLTAALSASGVAAQEQGAFASEPYHPNVPYDGRFTFARIRYTPPAGVMDFGSRNGRPDPKWDHDYPKSERHFMKILAELTTLKPRQEATNILTLDDPQLFKFPFAYLCEVGFWQPNDQEIAGLRSYLAKGGFVIVDDFAGERALYNFEAQIRKVLPAATLVPLTKDHPIFDSFYRIESIEFTHPYYQGLQSVFYGIYEDNDPKKRLIMIVDYNNDVSEYWEWSDTGLFAIDLSNEAYKLGVNYVVYAMTH
ncbi:MAG: DUF4159 domain-containing protein [Gemmatimonadota bacterium]